MSRPQQLLQLAIQVANESNYRTHHIGAVIARGPRVISVGTNRYGTHPRQDGKHTRSVHAELRALIGCRLWELKKADLYVARITRGGNIGLAKPCVNCQNIIVDTGIRRVFYTIGGMDDDGSLRYKIMRY